MLPAAASASASAEEATPAAAPSPDGDLATLGSLEDRESSEPQTLSDGDDHDHEQALEHDQDVDHDSGTGALTGDDLKQRIIKQAISLSLCPRTPISMYIPLKGRILLWELFFESWRQFENKEDDIMFSANGNGGLLFCLSSKTEISRTYLEFTLVITATKDTVLVGMDFVHSLDMHGR